MKLILKAITFTALQIILIVLGILTFLFFLQRLSGDPAAVLVGHNASPEVIAAIREEMGLNDPLLTQYAIFISKAVQLDFGESSRFQTSAMDVVLARFPNSLLLSLSALTLAVAVGVPVGIYAALRRGKPDGMVVTTLAGVLQSLPNFWLGLVLLLIFSVQLGWVGSVSNLEEDFLRRMALPTITLSTFYMARLIRLVRGSVLEELDQTYVMTAYSKGLLPRYVLFRHVLRNSMIPIIAFITLDLSFMVGGAIVVESLFSYSGMGDQMVKAIFNRDFAMVQASVFVIALFVVCVNMLSNALYHIVDPRIHA